MRIDRIIQTNINPASIGAVAALDVDINVAGLDLGHTVIAIPPLALEAGLVPQGAHIFDTGAGALRIRNRIGNPSAGAIDGADRVWLFLLVKEGE